MGSGTEEIGHTIILGGGFGRCKFATSTTVSGVEAMEMDEKRPNMADTLVDDEGVDEPSVSDDESHYSQEEDVVTALVQV